MLARLYETITGFPCGGLGDIITFVVFFGSIFVVSIGVLILLITLFIQPLSSFLKANKK